MNSATKAKKLTYVVNYMSANDSQHFVHIPNLLSELEKLGWSVDLLSERGSLGEQEILGRRVTFMSERSKLKRMATLARHLLEMRRRGGRVVFVRISKFAALLSALLGRVFGWKTVFWISGTVEDFNLKQGMRAKVGFAGMWILFRLIDRLATGPETMVDYYRRLYGLPSGKILLLYNDIDLSSGEVQGDRFSSDGLRVLMVHRLSPVRETERYFPSLVQYLETSAEKNGKIVLDVCGDGPERSHLEAIARRDARRVEVQFHGTVPQRDLAEFYNRATIFVMPSYREGFPRVVLEAMAHGLPIVATDAGGTRDILGPEQQLYVVDRRDGEAFGKAVSQLIQSAAERSQLASENIETVRRFSTSEVASMYDRALTRLINSQSRRLEQ